MTSEYWCSKVGPAFGEHVGVVLWVAFEGMLYLLPRFRCQPIIVRLWMYQVSYDWIGYFLMVGVPCVLNLPVMML